MTTDIDSLTRLLHSSEHITLAVATANGELICCHRRGVRDLYELLTRRPDTLQGATVADKVVGRGAAALMALGGVARLHADVLSLHARTFLEQAGILTRCDREVEHINNRLGNGLCPVEQLTLNADNPTVAFTLISDFLTKNSTNDENRSHIGTEFAHQFNI